jgi:hypothetical protein
VGVADDAEVLVAELEVVGAVLFAREEEERQEREVELGRRAAEEGRAGLDLVARVVVAPLELDRADVDVVAAARRALARPAEVVDRALLLLEVVLDPVV